MGRQGCSLSDRQIKTIIRLLASTDMQICDIAERIGCSKGRIIWINRKYSVRLYEGKRSSWKLAR
jgi:hypothetical protein